MESLLKHNYTVDDFIALLGKDFPLLEKYESTEQDSEWHAEGNVKIHTDMVLAETYKILEEGNYSLSEENVLVLAALFHDYAKPITTSRKDINGTERVVASKHEEIGASLLFTCSIPFNLSKDEWLQVIQLVAYHQVPKLLVVKNKDKQAYYQLQRNVGSMRLIYALEIADMLGRACTDKEEQVEYLDLFKMYCEEFGCWEQSPYESFKEDLNSKYNSCEANTIFWRGISSFEEGNIVMLEEEIPRSFGYINKKPHLVIMCGISGSGKSTHIASNYQGYEIISLDDIRRDLSKNPYDQKFSQESVRKATEKLRECLRNNKNVVWDATNIRYDFRQRIAALAFNYNAFVEIALVMSSKEEAIKGNKSRSDVVDQSVIDKQCAKFQIPSVEEAHKLSIIK